MLMRLPRRSLALRTIWSRYQAELIGVRLGSIWPISPIPESHARCGTMGWLPAIPLSNGFLYIRTYWSISISLTWCRQWISPIMWIPRLYIRAPCENPTKTKMGRSAKELTPTTIPLRATHREIPIYSESVLSNRFWSQLWFRPPGFCSSSFYFPEN